MIDCDNSAQMDSEREQRVRDMLATIDPLLDIRWFPTVAWNEATQRFSGRYGLICRWPEIDKRWELYRSGEIGEPFDCLGWFTRPAADAGDWHDPSGVPVDPEEMQERLLEFLGKMDLEREPWKKRMKRVQEANLEQRRKARADIVDEALQGMLHFRKKITGEHLHAVPDDLVDNTEKEITP